jgi:cobalt/nickel transport system ATP-binding protein
MGPEVFGDTELIKRARLKLPIVVDLYKELVSRDLLNGSRPPRNILELTDLVESGNQGTISRGALGTIHICNVDKVGPEEIKSILNESHVSYTGAMGTNAKMLAEQARIPLDFTYGVIDKCILKALTGNASLIMTSGGMVDHSVKRIRAYGEESGAKIEVVKISPPRESSVNSDRREILSQKDSTKPIEAAQ